MTLQEIAKGYASSRKRLEAAHLVVEEAKTALDRAKVVESGALERLEIAKQQLFDSAAELRV